MYLTQKTALKRLGIFFFFDKQGIVDDYVLYLLNGMKPFISECLVVSNGPLAAGSRQKLENEGCKVLERSNVGYDVWAYKEAMAHYGWAKLAEFDELVLFNYTIFGPMYPFKEMFDEMNARDVDFWGITIYNGAPAYHLPKLKRNFIPVHLQSHFICVRSSMLNSNDFHEYWDKMPEVKTYDDAVCYHEAIFTEKFHLLGYKWEAYIDTTHLKENTHYPLIMMPVEMVRDYRCPIIKRKSFFQDIKYYLDETCNERAVELFTYIKENLDYDINLIWDNLLRTCNQYDLKNCLNLNYILPTDLLKPRMNPGNLPKAALIMHIYTEGLIEYCYRYACSMPAYADVYITTGSEEKKEKILAVFDRLECSKLQVFVVKNRGRDVSALLIGCRDILPEYDLVCFAHDKSVAHIFPQTKGQSFSYSSYEGVLSSKNYVNNIIETFEENPRLGMLTPPPPNHSDYYPTIGDEWTCNFKNCTILAKELGINVDLSPEKPPIAPLGSIFWFRPKALKPLTEHEWKYEDFPEEPLNTDGTISHAIERIHPFAVQQSGYYPAWVMPDKFASIYITNIYYYLRTINSSLYKYGHHTHGEILDSLNGQFVFDNLFKNPQPVKKRLKWAARLLIPARVYSMLSVIRRRIFK
jgi:lipopolysaccharide biosynthesis protein